MTFIAVRCPHCQSDQIVKRGKTARGTQRYLCQNTLCTKGSFLLDYCNRGCLPEDIDAIINMVSMPVGYVIRRDPCISVPTPCCVHSRRKKRRLSR